MHSLSQVRSLAFSLAGAAPAPYSRCRLYSACAIKRQAPTLRLGTKATAFGRTRAASDPSKKTEAVTDSGLVSPVKASYGASKPSVEPLGEAESATWPRPSEIPFQAKMANFVNLIGHVHMPVQFQAAPDDGFCARTVITLDQPSEYSSFWIAVVFEGDLAHIAASHLKEKDHICVEGQLCPVSSAFLDTPGQTNIQVLVHSLNIVEGSSNVKLTISPPKHEKPATTKQDVKKKLEDSWRDLLKNPKEWTDHRQAKLEGSVNKKFPDFKRKDNTAALWLNSAPKWVLFDIEGIEFGGSDRLKPAKENKVVGDEAWNDLVENPRKWWDNRSNKIKSTYPDFKHKETGQALWLNSSPSWVLSKLPPLKPPEEAARSWSKAAVQQSAKVSYL